MTGDPDRHWHDAVHAAGRAVIARVLGIPDCANLFLDADVPTVGKAFIVDALQASEWTDHHSQRKVDHGAFWSAKIIAFLAGAEAEIQIIGPRAGSEERRCDVSGTKLAYAGDPPGPTTRMRRFARQLVKRHRTAILSFAEQLVAAEELDELLAGEKQAA